jgi:transcriptional regulator with XRE-family HTH domain
MGRQGMSNAHLARALGVSQAWTTRRLSLQSADTVLNLADLERIAAVLGVAVASLLPQTVRTGGLSEISDSTHPNGGPASLERPRLHAANRPISGYRRDVTRPSSPVPPNRRRPFPVRPGDRPIAA